MIPQIMEKYVEHAHHLAHEGKTGSECEYCGQQIYQEYPMFCKYCGARAKMVFTFIFGVPVFDAMDYADLVRWCPYITTFHSNQQVIDE